MKRLLLTVLFFSLPVCAGATTATYTGNIVVPTGATLTINGVSSGCLIASSGVVTSASCPQGTAAFSAGSNITITGTNPYTIACPNCFQTGGGTITGATTFGAAVTVNSTISESAAYTNTQSGAGVDFFKLGNQCPSSTAVTFSNNASAEIGTVAPTAWGNYCGSWILALDTTGNLAVANQVTATQFNISSKRSYKQDIQPLSLDALEVLHNVCWSSYRYRPGHGDTTQTHIGFIADCAPSVLSGKNHDHYDIEAVSTVDALAIIQLDTQIKVLYIIVVALTALLVLLGVALGLVARGKDL